MKVRNIFAAFLPVLLLSALTSCEEPSIYSEAPEYGKLKFTTEAPSLLTLENQGTIKQSSVCDPNDSVTVFMQVAYPGKFITKAEYTWKLYVSQDSVATKTVRVIAPHKQPAPPMWTFEAPSNKGKYSVTFKAKYDYSAQTEEGQIYGESSSYTGELNVR